MRRRWAREDVVPVAFAAIGGLMLAALLYRHFDDTPPDRAPTAAPVSVPLTGVRGTERPPRGRHVPFDVQSCLARTGRNLAPVSAVHRWIDARGIVHYSDRAPVGNDHREHRVETARDVQAVDVTLEVVDATLPPHARSRAIADAVAIGRVFDDVLGLDVRGGLALNVVLAGTDDAFRRYAPNSISQTGVYMPPRRLIVVRAQPKPEQTLAILRHEIVHALVHEWIGYLPTALNEGLADYFEAFTPQGMGGRVDPSVYVSQMQRTGESQHPRAELDELLALPHADFHGYRRGENYRRSLALVSTLMAIPSRRAALAAVLQAQRRQPCSPVDAAHWLEPNWPGGLDDLAAAWNSHQRGEGLGHHNF